MISPVNAPTSNELLKAFVTYLTGILGSASLLCALMPPIMAALAPDLIPPWPEKTAVLTSGVCAFVTLSLFFGIRHQSERSKRLWGALLCALAFIAFLSWIASSAFFVVTVIDGGREHRVIRGFDLQENASKKVESGEVVNTPAELLKGFGENSPELIWTYVALSKMLVFITFVLTFSSVVGSLSAFALQDFRESDATRGT